MSLPAAVLKAVNLCGDADSVGSVTAQIAGALYGARSIPKDWLAALNQWDDGEKICDIPSHFRGCLALTKGTIAGRALRLYRRELLPGSTCEHAPIRPLPLDFKFTHARGCICAPRK